MAAEYEATVLKTGKRSAEVLEFETRLRSMIVGQDDALTEVVNVFQAVTAGAKPQMPPMDVFWGDRYCKFTDPFGHNWAVATHIEDVPQEEMEKRSKAEFAKWTDKK